MMSLLLRKRQITERDRGLNRGQMENNKKIIYFIAAFAAIIIISVAGYSILLDLTLIDALYMTVITISTVGYKEVAVMNPEAKLFTVLIIFMSVGTGAFLVSRLLSSFSEGDLKEAWRKNRMENTIAGMENHYIICGSGETGFYIISQFQKREVPFVVIDNKTEVIQKLKETGVNYILGDATQEETLKKARIDKAKGLIASLSKDADNVFVVLTARQMNIDLRIVARAIEKTSHEKLRRAGANDTVSPNEIGGRRLATLMLKPSVASIWDTLVNSDDAVLDLEEILIGRYSELCGAPLKEIVMSEKTGLIVMGMRKRGDKKFQFSPGLEENLGPGDKIVVLGPRQLIDKVINLAKEKEKENQKQ